MGRGIKVAVPAGDEDINSSPAGEKSRKQDKDSF